MTPLKRLARKLETIATSRDPDKVLSPNERIRLMLIAAQHAAASEPVQKPGATNER